ncbi:MAG: type II toxin-antitoxin system prevent-host-death family antitoxin [Acidobacteriota bacterium]|nr:MAG: type II toxin-antitoxin system prevent-host-death family antitoxin [Acidobacteriota bacterium]
MQEKVTLEEAKLHLAELISKLQPGEEIVITQDSRPVAELRSLQQSAQPRFGSCRGMLTIVAEDDEHLKDFEEYMP